MPRNALVTTSEPRAPMKRPKKPARIAPASGNRTIAWYMRAGPLALYYVDVFDRDRAAVAEVDDDDRQADRRLARSDREHEQREHLADEIAQEGRERDQVDVDREQHQLDRHQDDDDVLAVEENAEDAEREQHRRHGQVMA